MIQLKASRITTVKSLTSLFRSSDFFLHQQTRSVYIPSSKRKSRATSSSVIQQPVSEALRQLESRLKQLESYTQGIRATVKYKEDERLRDAAEQKNNETCGIDGVAREDVMGGIEESHLDNMFAALESGSEANGTNESVKALGSGNGAELGNKNSKRLINGQSKTKSPVDLFIPDSKDVPFSSLLTDRIGSAMSYIASKNSQNWVPVVKSLYNSGQGLKGVERKEVSMLISMIPIKQRGPLMPIICEMMTDASIESNKFINDMIMAAYADRGDVEIVQGFFDQIVSSKQKLDVYTFGHLFKALSKRSDLESSLKYLNMMTEMNIKPNNKIKTTILQTCIKVGNYDQAFGIFDGMKFLSTKTLPDLKVYNSLIIGATMNNEIERALDLYREMTTRPVSPLTPDSQTVVSLVRACAKKPELHIKAWNFIYELKQSGHQLDRSVMNSMMYLCGRSGDIAFSRAIFNQLCMSKESFPDSDTLQGLMKSYSLYTPGQISPILGTELGINLRTNFFTHNVTQFLPGMPPFLPFASDLNAAQILAESRAILSWVKEKRPDMINEHVINAYLDIAAKLQHTEEFISRWNEETEMPIPLKKIKQRENKAHLRQESREAQPTEGNKAINVEIITESDEKRLIAEKNRQEIELLLGPRVPRNQFFYGMALQSIKDEKYLDFAQTVWDERGKYRKLPAFQKLGIKQKKDSDFAFARSMVSMFARVGHIDEALAIIKSSKRNHDWHIGNVVELYQILVDIDDFNKIEELKLICRASRAFDPFKQDKARDF